jgi:2-polyprenyl-6-methoxyphenol hydroxylase-like FAD-dependent oxidoreductase
MKNESRDHAVVCGGSLAGLFVARVLADVYRQVTVVERDELDAGYSTRRGAPQARHVHGLLARGCEALEELFPGLTAELVADGAPTMDMLADGRMYLGAHRLVRAHAGLPVLSISRPFLEGHVRARVRALPNVTVLDRCDVLGLTASSGNRRVAGARVLRRADSSAEEILPADVVVDATGRGSRAPVWLETLGYRRPARDELRIRLGYATRRYRLPPDVLGGDRVALLGATPEHPRAALLQLVENERWILTLAGILGDYPPTQPDGFLDFAASLPVPDIVDAVRDGEPLDDPVPFRFLANVRHRYERLPRWPAGFLVTGDALCSTSPLYGLGMSVAAIEALLLRKHLGTSSGPRPEQFMRDVARVVDVPWNLTLGADLAFPRVSGRRSLATRAMTRYMSRMQGVASHDPVVATAFARVSALVDRPQALLRPGIARRVLSSA